MSDRRARARALAIVAALAAVAVGTPSCAGVLDVELAAYRDALQELCRCDPAGLGDACLDRLTARFEQRGASAYAALVAAYGDHGCAECESSAACFYEAPACSDADCVRTEECCGYLGKTRICKITPGASVGTCSACTKIGAVCKGDDECCAGTGQGRCLGVGAAKFCVESCEPSDPRNCPGCCQHVVGTTGPKQQAMDLCADATPGFECRPYCTGPGDVASCPPGKACVGAPLELATGIFTVYGCQ